LSPEANGNSRQNIAAGGILSVGFDINDYFSIGFKKAYSADFNGLTVAEDALFFRYYPIVSLGLFLQADLGTSVFFEENKNILAAAGGLVAGWRFNIGNNFYIEPQARGGYPFIWGFGINAGARFKTNSQIEKNLESADIIRR